MKNKIKAVQNTQTAERVQCEGIEHELKKSPDFQLYMLTPARRDRERMERLLEKLPAFRMWRQLSQRIEAPTQPARTAYQDRA